MLLGFALAAASGGCAQNAGLGGLTLLGGGDDATTEAAASAPEEGVVVADAPPLPVRDERRRKGGGAPAQAVAANEAPKPQGGLSLPSLGEVKLFSPAAYAPDSVEWDQNPVAVYTVLAQRIRACWLKPGASKLPDHGFHAEVEPGDQNATIIIFKKDPQGKRGLMAFRLQISGGQERSTVQAESRRLDPKMDVAFKADLARWAKGKPEC